MTAGNYLRANLIRMCLITAVVLGIYLRLLLPEHHLGADTKDAVKLAMGLSPQCQRWSWASW